MVVKSNASASESARGRWEKRLVAKSVGEAVGGVSSGAVTADTRTRAVVR